MRRYVFLASLFIILNACQDRSFHLPNRNFGIPGNWTIRESGKDQSYPATVPGTVHTDLLNNNLIEDPYYRLNELDVQWIDKTDWEYTCEFEADHDLLKYDNLDLVFDGLDTYADVYLNDSLVLHADNMFRTWRIECKGILRPGKNKLLVLLRSPTREGLKRMEAYGLELPAGNDQSERGGMGEKRVSPFVRKAPYHFGWDWGPRLVTSGIWRPVWIEAWDDVRFMDALITLENLDSTRAAYKVRITTVADKSSEIPVRVYVDGVLANSGNIGISAGKNFQDLEFVIPDPELWWPNGSGSQKLYRVAIELGKDGDPVDRKEYNIGVRQVRLVQSSDPDGTGKSFYFEVNGRPLFAKGANYIPNDIFLTRVSHEDYEFIIKSAAEANMNMLRVWGGGVYEEDYFYDLCDRYGIMVWQDFMFACSMYPGNDEFLESVRQEAIDNVTRLRNHPCLALWCGNNEIEVAWAEWEENRGWGWKQQYDSIQRKKIWHAYDTLFHHILPGVVREYDPLVPYWPSSPSAGPGMLASYTTTSGDMHYWGVWHGLDPISDFRKYRARFMSEYGFQSFPEFNSVKKYTVPADWDIESEVMASHQRSGIGNLRIRQYMEQDYNVPGDFEQFLYVGQVLQADAIKTAIEAHRSEMPYCMGSLYWQINDCWPVASWSGIDYYKRWKALHYFVKKAFEPVIVVISKEEGLVTTRVISDLPENITADLMLKVIDFDGKVFSSETLPITVEGNSSREVFKASLTKVLNGKDPSSTFLDAELSANDSHLYRALFYFAKPRDMKLGDPGIKASITEDDNNFIIALNSAKLAKSVFLSADGFKGQFSDNYFDILPGENIMVIFPKERTLEEFRNTLKIMHL